MTGERTEASPPVAATTPIAPTAPSVTTAADGGRPIQPVTPGKPLIQIVIPYSTLIGADDHPAELVGIGPIPAHSPARPLSTGSGAAWSPTPSPAPCWTTAALPTTRPPGSPTT